MKKGKILALLLSVLFAVLVFAPAAYAIDFNDIEGLWGLIGGQDVNGKTADGILDSILGGGNGKSISISDLLSGNLLDRLRGTLGRAADGTSDSDLISAVISLLGGNSALTEDLFSSDFLNMISAYLAGENVTTTEAETAPPTTRTPETTAAPETTTEEPTTEPPTTQPPVTQPPATEPPTAAPQRTPTYPTSSYPTAPYTQPTTAAHESTTYYQYIPVVSETVSELVPGEFTPVVYDSDDGLQDGVSAKMIIGIIILVLSGAAVAVVAVILKKSRI